MQTGVFSLLAIWALTACQPPVTGSTEISQVLAPAERAACHAEYGEVVTSGFGSEACQRPTTDSGRSCASGYDCEGFCIAQDAAETGTGATGICSAQDVIFGCFDVVVNGETATLCVD